MKEDNFRFYVPAEIIKGGEKKEMRIKGIASTGGLDQQGEELLPNGLDISYLVTKGFINWHHQLKTNPLAVIGVPDPKKTKVTSEGLYVEAVLYNNSPMAKKAYQQTEIMAAQDLGRKMGWSVEGKVLERDPLKSGRVTKAAITGIALTPMPINADTFAQICKSFEGEGIEGQDETEDEVEKSCVTASPNGGTSYSLSHKLSEDSNEIVININLNKAMTTGSARAVMPESLDNRLKVMEFEGNKKLTKAELFPEIIAKHPELNPTQIVAVAERIINNRK